MRALRLSHFPPSTYQENQFGLAPHTDANFFTVLPQAIVERLYIRPQGRGWLTPVLLHPACRLPDCLTCCSAANPAKYPPITYGEYRVWWLNNNYRTKLVEA